MRLAYVCADAGVPVFGCKGCSIHVQEMLRAFRHCGAEVELFAARRGGDTPNDLSDVVVHDLSGAKAGDQAERERQSIRANRNLSRALARSEPFDAVYERYSLWSFAGMSMARRWGTPGILEVNAPLIEEQSAHRSLVHDTIANRVARRAFAAASHLLAVSQPVANYLKQFPGTALRTHVVPNGVNVERFAETATRESLADRLTIGFVGSLKPWHGLNVLIEAFADLASQLLSSRLLIVGDGPERSGIENELIRRGLRDRACLPGAVPHVDIPDCLAVTDIAVAPYPRADNFYFSPLKVLEYMAAGRAIVASDIGQIRELIQHEATGLLTPPGDAQALSHACMRLAADPQLRGALGRRARSEASRKHSWDGIAKQVLRWVGAESASCAMMRGA